MKREIFKREIGLIRRVELRDFVEEAIQKIPDYFFEVPASTTGKHHPKFALGKGGLVRHTKAAIKIAENLLNLRQNWELPFDEIIIALIFHDSFKLGENPPAEYTVKNHPELASEFILHYAFSKRYVNIAFELMGIARMIGSHMGEWGPMILESEAQEFVHMCDYLASRKFMEIEIE